jgi:hypothetical protein
MQYPDQAAQADQKRLAFGLVQPRDQPGVPVVEFGAQPGVRGGTFPSEAQSIEAVIRRIALAYEEPLLFQLGYQPAYRALFQPQPVGQLLLRHSGAGVELMQGKRLRQREGLIRVQQAGKPGEIHHQAMQFVRTRNRPDSSQLCNTTPT